MHAGLNDNMPDVLKTLRSRPLFVMDLDVRKLQIVGVTPGAYRPLIGMAYRGVRHGPPDVVARIEKGEVVGPASYYFRINPLFQSSAEKYDWINRAVAFGIGYRRADGPIYSVFEVL